MTDSMPTKNKKKPRKISDWFIGFIMGVICTLGIQRVRSFFSPSMHSKSAHWFGADAPFETQRNLHKGFSFEDLFHSQGGSSGDQDSDSDVQPHSQGSSEDGEEDSIFGGSSGWKFSINTMSDDVKIEQSQDDRSFYYDVMGNRESLKDIQVQAENGVLTITGQFEKKTKKGNFESHVSSSFNRSFALPAGVDEKAIQMETLEDKVRVIIPKQK